MALLSKIDNFLNRFNIQIRRYPTRLLRNRSALFNAYSITHVLDVGANIGQYGTQLRLIGFQKSIISFEPTIDAFSKLDNIVQKDPNWNAYHLGLSDTKGEQSINIASNSSSSSLLAMNDTHRQAVPDVTVTRTEIIQLTTLDDFLLEHSSLTTKENNLFLKIDTQGYEMNVLKGAKNSLVYIKGLQIEMSLFSTYDGETLFLEMVNFLDKKGFRLHSLEPGISNHTTGKLLQVDGIFFRR